MNNIDVSSLYEDIQQIVPRVMGRVWEGYRERLKDVLTKEALAFQEWGMV